MAILVGPLAHSLSQNKFDYGSIFHNMLVMRNRIQLELAVAPSLSRTN